MSNEQNCKSCKGSGKQVFHGAFDSVIGECNFCNGSGSFEDYEEWFEIPFGRKVKNPELLQGE